LKEKKIYLTILVIFLILMLWVFTGILSSCSFLAEELNEATTITAASSASTIAETTAIETTAETTAAETTAPETTVTETTAPETTAAETTGPPETTPPPVAPTIKLSIYEGPTYSSVDDLCYDRIQATVTGTPRPTVTFSKDDSNGTWGKYKVQVNLSRTNPDYTLTATAKNSAGTATASIKLSWGCGPLIIEKTMEFNPSNVVNIDSAGTIDNGSVTFGDNAADKDVRGFFAFNINPLSGKNLISASLKLIDPNTTAKIDFKGNIQIWYVDFLAGGITGSDYMNVPYSGSQSFKWNADPLQFSTDFLKNIISDRAEAQRKLEFGIWFADSTIGGDSGVKEVRTYHNSDIVLTVVYAQ
jgi:hypothetical protein